ncbi:signal peptidase II [Lacunimicrobium album]
MKSVDKHFARRALEVLAVILVIVVADQASKLWAVETLKGEPMTSYLGDVFRIVYAENTGGFLSLGSTLPAAARFWLLTVINGVVLTIGLTYVMAWRNLGPVIWWGVTLLVAGGMGNLIDRVRLEGSVIDFLNMGIGNLRTGIFNIADIAISVGVLLFFMSSFAVEKKTESGDSKTREKPDSHPSDTISQGMVGSAAQ